MSVFNSRCLDELSCCWLQQQFLLDTPAVMSGSSLTNRSVCCTKTRKSWTPETRTSFAVLLSRNISRDGPQNACRTLTTNWCTSWVHRFTWNSCSCCDRKAIRLSPQSGHKPDFQFEDVWGWPEPPPLPWQKLFRAQKWQESVSYFFHNLQNSTNKAQQKSSVTPQVVVPQTNPEMIPLPGKFSDFSDENTSQKWQGAHSFQHMTERAPMIARFLPSSGGEALWLFLRRRGCVTWPTEHPHSQTAWITFEASSIRIHQALALWSWFQLFVGTWLSRKNLVFVAMLLTKGKPKCRTWHREAWTTHLYSCWSHQSHLFVCIGKADWRSCCYRADTQKLHATTPCSGRTTPVPRALSAPDHFTVLSIMWDTLQACALLHRDAMHTLQNRNRLSCCMHYMGIQYSGIPWGFPDIFR